MKKIEMLNGDVRYFEEVDGGFKEVEKPGRWKAAYNDHYYFTGTFYKVYDMYWVDSERDTFNYIANNCFKTREEAERKAEIMKLIYENVGINSNRWHTISYDVKDNALSVYNWNVTHDSPYYFPSEEIAKMIIDKVGVEDWKKYVLGIYE